VSEQPVHILKHKPTSGVDRQCTTTKTKHEQHWQAQPLLFSPDDLPPAKKTKPEGNDAAANS
jgi:hypothetical protein